LTIFRIQASAGSAKAEPDKEKEMKRPFLIAFGLLFLILPALASNIQVLAPAAGDSWKIGTTQSVQWTFAGIPPSTKVNIVLRKTGAGKLGEIATEIPIGTNGQGSFSWTVGAIIDAPAAGPGQGYYFKVKTPDGSVSGESGTFSLTSGGSGPATQMPPASTLGSDFRLEKDNGPSLPGTSDAQVKMIQVISPAAGAILSPLGSCAVSWKFVNIPEANVQLVLLLDGQPAGTLTGIHTNPHEFLWNLAQQPPDPGAYKVRVETLDQKHHGLSGVFSVKEEGGIDTLFPIAGNQFYNNVTFDVRWKRSGNIQLVDIVLKKKDSDWQQVLANGVAAKLEKQNISLHSADAGEYRIEFRFSSDGAPAIAYSPYFTIMVN
jgi:hypothetical protein